LGHEAYFRQYGSKYESNFDQYGSGWEYGAARRHQPPKPVPLAASLTPQTVIALHALLSDGLMVFVWAYARSCQQYVAVQKNLVPPDMFRLRHRRALSEVVAAIVRADEAASDATVRARTPPSVPEADRTHFVDLVLAEFKALHAGNAVRFGIGPLALAAWREKHGQGG
jgi:hypothetical protein